MIVAEALSAPETVPHWPLVRLDRLIREARRTQLLGQLAHLLHAGGNLASLPNAPRAQMVASLIFAAKHRRDVAWEVRCLERALAGIPTLLLKGAAYTMTALRPGWGRIFSDIDLMVPKVHLATAEAALRRAGWAAVRQTPYDEHYYRTWMHEVPALVHVRRGSTIDLHHALVPPTARGPIPVDALWVEARPLGSGSAMGVLSPVDMVLHSAVHLLDGGTYRTSLRDLYDIHALVLEFGARSEFWPGLCRRARAFGRARSIGAVLAAACAVFGTPVPHECLRELAGPRPGVLDGLRILLVRAALTPERFDAGARLACGALYLRSHYVRMPLGLLVPHLTRKVVRAVGAPHAGR